MKLPTWTILVLVCGGCVAAMPEGADLAPDARLARYDLAVPAAHWRLPAALEEISGLVDDGPGAVIAHHDNDARLWRLTLRPSLKIVPDPGPWIDGDFEGVARRNHTWYLLRSPGVVYRRARDPGHTGPVVVDTAAARGRCNFEGIETLPDGSLLLACKYPRAPRAQAILLYRIAPRGEPATPIAIDVSALLAATGLRRVRPSGLAWLGHDRLLVLAGKERLLLEIDTGDWRLLAWRGLAPIHHRQAEGLAVLTDGTLVIADEADGRKATLTTYRPLE
jgi:hypothetical protein